MTSPAITAQSRGIKIGQLCRESGFTRSTIHHYINTGLLPRPRTAGLSLHLFDDSHLARLRQIHHLREREGLTLQQIKELLDKVHAYSVLDPLEHARTPLPEGEVERLPEGDKVVTRQTQKNRDKILDAAIKLFSERGYENTKINDITDALQMGKGTFYVYFKSKKGLFLECIDRMTLTIVPREAWDEIRKEQDFYRKLSKRGTAFLKAFPDFRGILNLLRVALGSNDPLMTQKAVEAFKVLSKPMAKDLRRAIEQGVIQKSADVDFLAYLQLVIGEGLGYWLMMDPRYSVETGMEILMDLFSKGFAIQSAEKEKQPGGVVGTVEVRDTKGVTTHLKNVRVEGRPCLAGRRGEARVEVDLGAIADVQYGKTGAQWRAEVNLKDGQQIVVEVEGEQILMGEASFGSFQIPLKRISRLSLVNYQRSLRKKPTGR